MVNVLFVGVFDTTKRSTNTSQLISFKRVGCNVLGYNYRKRALEIGNQARDNEIIDIVEERKPDLVVYSKCNVVSEKVFVETSKKTKTCLWFMDPLVSYDSEMRSKTKLVNYFCCDKMNVYEEAKKINPNCFHVCEGFDEEVDFPVEREKEWDVSFIGNVYGNRESIIKNIETPVAIVNNAYGKTHSSVVSGTKINLNFCTSGGASDRVYKIMAASGFLLTNDWHGREKHFKDGEDLVIFDGVDDLNKKIDFYLKNKKERDRISLNGHQTVQNFTRKSWAKNIINLYEQIK